MNPHDPITEAEALRPDTAAVGGSSSSEGGATYGWLFQTDDGLEWCESHPIESGESQYAEDIRVATGRELVEELQSAWRALADAEAAALQPSSAEDAKGVGEVILFGGITKEVAWAKGKLPPVGTKLYAQPHPSQQGGAEGVDEDWIRGLIGEAVVMSADDVEEGSDENCRIAEAVLDAIRPYLNAQPHPSQQGGAEGVERIAAFLKERDEALEPGEADDSEREASAQAILAALKTGEAG